MRDPWQWVLWLSIVGFFLFTLPWIVNVSLCVFGDSVGCERAR